MRKFVAIDPGLNGLGLAFFEEGFLLKAEFLPNEKTAKDPLPNRVYSGCIPEVKDQCRVIELPKIYRAFLQKGDPNDLIKLALVVGRLTTKNTVYLLPQEWKHTVPKDIMQERIRMRLSALEISRIKDCPKYLEHNLYDAIGIGLFYCNRLLVDRVIAR